ncbi:ribosomal RNA adenine dimethylase [Tenacibaculum todarodis]|uniref:Ribosomal RNA adenine dimethylase n=1 Tax=Tenacibaculum todarodis TaxID=1850252 RepID=A0A1L3JLC7_9FLAO|nr:methyltransferase [Tenacibaculum todarodis]APG65894.1 ribosomal RNA adenine dimethylase [Tenacibaculum todarodis]
MTNRLKFFKEAVKSLKTSGTVTPSSRFLAKRMIAKIDFATTDVVVELGAGNGVITKQILKKLHPKATLVCFEINDNFYKDLLKIKNKQLVVLNTSAEKIEEELAKLGFSEANHIISSLPFTIIPDAISTEILEKAYKVLASKGTFMQYQYSLTYFKKLSKVFSEEIKLEFEPLNFPPAFVYRCIK